MDWNITAGRPVYVQLIDQLEMAIVTGEYALGSRVPAVRELAAEAGVNPNTMQRALQELESRGLLQSKRTSGRIVSADKTMLCSLRAQRAEICASHFLDQMRKLGYTREEVLDLLRQTELSATDAPKEES